MEKHILGKMVSTQIAFFSVGWKKVNYGGLLAAWFLGIWLCVFPQYAFPGNYSLSPNPSEGGTVTPTRIIGMDSPITVTIYAYANPNWIFTKWTIRYYWSTENTLFSLEPVTSFNPGMEISGTNRLIAWFTPIRPAITQLNPGEALAGGASFQLHVAGDNFLPESVLRWNGSDRQTTFISTNELTAEIPGSDIRKAGTAAITVANVLSGGSSESDPWVFTIRENPFQPVISQLNPPGATEGSPAFSLLVSGYAFTPDSLVRWNDSDRPTSFISANELSAEIQASDIYFPGTARISVRSVSNGTTYDSEEVEFIIYQKPPLPEILQLTPAETIEGGAAFILHVIGNGFVSNTTIRWNNFDRQTTYISATELSTEISGEDIAKSGKSEITVVNRSLDNKEFTSNSFPFIIYAKEKIVETIPTLTEWGMILFFCVSLLLAVRRLKVYK
jgi:hypothetical protein